MERNNLLPSETTKKRLELLQSKGKITEEKKNELLQVMIGNDDELQKYNGTNEILSSNRKVSDRKINKGLRDYSFNHDSKEDIEWQKNLGGYQKKQATKQEKLKDKEIKNENNRAKLSSEDKESVNKGLKELLKYIRSYTETWNKKYLEQRQNRTPKQLKTVEGLEKESGNKVKCIVDKKFIELFRKLMGTSYRGGGILGERVVVDDPKTLEDEAFLRHEAIHCAQQREMGGLGKKGFIRWTVMSGVDLAKKQFLGETAGLDETADFATDNQITDYETYMNQFTKGYLKNRQSFAFKKYADPKFRKQEYERIRNTEYTELKQKQEKLQKELKYSFTPDKRALISQKLEDIQSELNQMEAMLDKLKNDNEVRVVMIKPDVPNTKKEDGKFQVWTESEKNRKIRLPIERFIQKHGKEENGYLDGIELRLDFQSTLKEMVEKYKLDENSSKKLEKELKSEMKKHGKLGIEIVKAEYKFSGTKYT